MKDDSGESTPQSTGEFEGQGVPEEIKGMSYLLGSNPSFPLGISPLHSVSLST
jgi:hypothetical protein